MTDSGLFRLLAASRDASRAGPPPDPGHIADLAAAVASLDFLADERNRAVLLRELPPPFSLGLSSANNSLAFSRGLAWNALSDHPDLDPLLDALDRFDEIHADPILDARVFPALDRLRRQPISWSEVARLRRLLTETERPGGAGLIDPGAFDVVVLNFLRNNRGLSEIPSDALLRPGAFAARLATLPVTQASAPPLLHFVREVESLVPDPLRSQLKDWVDGVAVRLGVEAPSPAPAGVTAKAERAADESTRLVICLEPYLYKSDHFAVNAWLVRWGRDVKVACDHAEITREAVIDMINKRLRKLRDNEPREVELFLPVEMLAEGVARWEVTVVGTQKVGIDARFPVKLRCLDRLPPVDPAAEDEDDDSPFDEVARQLWKDRWGKRPGAGKPLKDFCIPLDLNEGYEETALYKQWMAAGPVCVAESLVPLGREGDKKLAADNLKILLVAGTPVLVWPGAGSVACPPIYTEPNGTEHPTLLSFVTHGDCLDALPLRVHDQRKQAGSFKPRPDWNLCLLWDDPERLPPSHEHKDLYISQGYRYT